MKILKFFISAAAVMTLMACEPLEDSSWTNNSHVSLSWKFGNAETGQRPAEIDSFFVYYYSQTENNPNRCFYIHENKGAYDVKTDCYDLLVTHDHPFLHRAERFKSSTIKLPTHVNDRAEVVVTDNPSQMIYAGMAAGVNVNWDERSTIYIDMQQMFKKMNFVVTISDTLELEKPCTVDMSGMTSQLKIWSGEKDEETQCIQIFDLVKHGRYLNTDRYLTAYTGHVLCLGTVGRNILYFRFTDASGAEREARYELTSYLSDWNTDEVTVRIKINADDNEVFLEGWEEGDTTDFLFGVDYENGWNQTEQEAEL